MSLFFKPCLSKWEPDLCKLKTAVPEVNLLVLKWFPYVFYPIFVFLLIIIVIMFCTELVSSVWLSFLRRYDYCFAYYEVHYFPAASFCTVLMTKLCPEQQRKCKFKNSFT